MLSNFLSSPYSLYIIAIVILIAFIIGAFSFYKFNKWLNAFLLKRKFQRGEQGELKARDFLLRQGFSILEEQPVCHSSMWIDELEKSYFVKADFLVEKEGCKAIVEVKTGNVATNPASINTRRQLFEYTHLYDVDEVLFFNAETLELCTISFNEEEEQEVLEQSPKNWHLFWIGLVLGVVITIIIFFALKHISLSF